MVLHFFDMCSIFGAAVKRRESEGRKVTHSGSGLNLPLKKRRPKNVAGCYWNLLQIPFFRFLIQGALEGGGGQSKYRKSEPNNGLRASAGRRTEFHRPHPVPSPDAPPQRAAPPHCSPPPAPACAHLRFAPSPQPSFLVSIVRLPTPHIEGP
jgi:hypothetical protein